MDWTIISIILVFAVAIIWGLSSVVKSRRY
jgi:hypothetical protein